MSLPSAKRQSVWCPHCRDFRSAWVIGGTAVCLQCGRECPEFETRATSAGKWPATVYRLAVHRHCWTCGAAVDSPRFLIHPADSPATPTLSQWLCIMADALMALPDRRPGQAGKQFRNGPVVDWRIWCPSCAEVRQFRLCLETTEKRIEKPYKPHEFERDLKPKQLAMAI